MKWAMLLGMAWLLCGCATARTGTERTHAVEVVRTQIPITAADGSMSLVAVVTTKETTSDVESEEQLHQSVDVPAIVQAGAPIAQMIGNAATGNWGALVGEGLALITGTAGAAMAARGKQKQMQAEIDYHKTDAAEQQARADQHAAKCLDLARQLPPG